MKTLSEKLSAFVMDLDFDALPAAVQRQAKVILYDGLGLILSGYQSEHGNLIHDFIRERNLPPEATILGYGTRTDCPSAALANGILCYTHDYSDTVLECVVHCEPAIVPALLAVAEYVGASGKALLGALVAGYEVMSRVAMAINSGTNRMMHQSMGFHPTSTCGVFGVAATAGKLLCCSESQICNAFGLAGSMASGILEALTSTPISMTRRLHGGNAAFSGIVAVLLARKGFTGPSTVFEGKNGFLKAFTDGRYDTSPLESVGDGKFFILDASIKYRNCIHAAASPIDAVIGILEENAISAEEIASMEARIPSPHYNIFMAKKDMYHPLTYGDAQTSLPYCLAAACLCGQVSVDEFHELKRNDPAILSLARKVSLRADAAMDEAFHNGMWPAEVQLTLNNGKQFLRRLDFPKGSPQNPLSFEEHRSKFAVLSKPVLGDQRRSKATEWIWGMEHLSNIRSLIQILVSEKRVP